MLKPFYAFYREKRADFLHVFYILQVKNPLYFLLQEAEKCQILLGRGKGLAVNQHCPPVAAAVTRPCHKVAPVLETKENKQKARSDHHFIVSNLFKTVKHKFHEQYYQKR